MRYLTLICAAAGSILIASAAHAGPIDHRFNYQGRLTSAGVPVNGLVDLRFSLWDADVAGVQKGPTIDVLGEAITDGLFNSELDFGPTALDGDMRWLQIEIRSPAGAGAYSTLGRQEILGTPYAIQTRGLFVSDDLNVGIGTTSPGATLHVGGNNPFVLVEGSDPFVLVKDDGTSVGVQLSSSDLGGVWAPLSISTDLFGAIGTMVVQNAEVSQLNFYDTATGAPTATLGESAISDTGVVALRGPVHTETALLLGDGDFDANNGVDVGTLSLRSIGGGSGGEVSIQRDTGDETIELLGGATGESGSLSMFNVATGDATVSILGNNTGNGGRIATFSEDGDLQFIIEPSSFGTGTYMTLSRSDASTGLLYNGNTSGTNDPHFTVSGPSRAVDIRTDLTGTQSVALPLDAIDAAEILDEPGVASNIGNSTVTLTGAVNTILSRTITAPTSGYCVVIGTCQAFINHSNGTTSTANFGVSDTSASLPANQDVALQLSGNTPSGSYVVPVTVHGTFSVGAGANTFYLLGDENGGAFSASDGQLSVMFFPTSYGAVTPTLLARGGNDNDASAPQVLPMTANDIYAEQLQAVAFDQNRRNTEADDYAQRFAELESRLEQVLAEQESMRGELRRASPPMEVGHALNGGHALNAGAALGHNNTTHKE